MNNETQLSKKKRGYGNYYDDIEPEDVQERVKHKTDTGLALKIALIVFGLIVSIAVCITVLSLA